MCHPRPVEDVEAVYDSDEGVDVGMLLSDSSSSSSDSDQDQTDEEIEEISSDDISNLFSDFFAKIQEQGPKIRTRVVRIRNAGTKLQSESESDSESEDDCYCPPLKKPKLEYRRGDDRDDDDDNWGVGITV